MTDKPYYTEQEAAAYLGLRPEALRKRRRLGLPPAFYKIGRTVRYRPDDLAAICVRHEPLIRSAIPAE